jgi:hypothetical protein
MMPMRMPASPGWGLPRWLAAGAAVALAAAALTTAGPTARAAASVVNVTVNADEGLGTVPGTAYGANQAV